MQERDRHRPGNVEDTPLGRVGDRELRGVVERREIRLGPVVFGRVRPRAVDVYEPGLGRRTVQVDAPVDPYLRALRWVLVMVVLAWVAGAVIGRTRTRK
ncbi:MAG: hypothetical protein K1X87_07955 [Dehalococcoidia bacterium]|nr:hypothetical protein [Dehalococcoidia bacterium]